MPVAKTPGPATPMVRDAAPPRDKDAQPVLERGAFEACLHAHEHAPCRRAFEATVERYGGFALAPGGNRLGTQPIDALPSLEFQDGPHWLRTLESVSQDGITFKRVRRGSEHELSFGISREGVLGFTLAERPGSER